MRLLDSWDNTELTKESSCQLIELHSNHYRNAGITRFDKVIFIYPTSSHWIINYHALEKIGAIIIPIDPEDQAQFEEKLKIANASFIISSETFNHETICNDYDTAIISGNQSVYIYKSKTRKDQVSNCHQMIFTSGTDQTPKLVMLTKNAIDMVVDYYASEFRQYKFDKIIIALPLSAIYTFSICLAAIRADKKLIFANYKKQNIFNVIIEHNVNLLPAVPIVVETIYAKITNSFNDLNYLLKKLVNLSISGCIQIRRFTGINIGRIVFRFIHQKTGNHLKVILSGGAKIPSHVLYLMYGLGYTIFEGYGLTETAGVITVRKGEYETIGTVGKPINDVKITLGSERDSHEIVIKTNQSFIGYYGIGNQPHTFNESFQSGDIGLIRSDGNIIISGRIKNILILPDEKKINSEWLEEEITKLTGIQNPIVIGFNNPESFGDSIIIFFEKESLTNQSHQAILDFINSSIKHICKIDKITYVDKFPRNKLGKCNRKELKNSYMQALK